MFTDWDVPASIGRTEKRRGGGGGGAPLATPMEEPRPQTPRDEKYTPRKNLSDCRTMN